MSKYDLYFQIETHTSDRSIVSFSKFIDNLVAIHDTEYTKEKTVQEDVLGEDLTDKDFYIELAKPGLFFVKFYAPWCR